MAEKNTNFRSKILNSAKLTTIKFASEVGLRLISTIVLTRLLAPETYGVFAVVLVFIYLLEMFSDLGLRSLVLTKEGDVEDEFLHVCWTVSILRGVMIALCASLIGLGIGQLQAIGAFAEGSSYNATVLPWAVAAVGCAPFVMGFQSPLRFVYEREMRFETATVLDIVANLCALIVTVSLAIYLRSIWALVLGSLARSILYVMLSFIYFHGPRMALSWNRTYLSLLVSRGKWIVLHSMLTALGGAADRLILGLVMSSSTFGFYYIARQLLDLGLGLLAKINGQVGLQVFRHLQGSTPADFRRNYYRYRFFFDALAGVGAGVGLILAPLFVDVVFDDRYSEVAPIVQLLVPAVLLTGPLLLRESFSAERRFKEMTWLSIVSTATLWVGLVIAVFLVDSVTVALIFVALYRLPEAILLTISGYKRGWITPLQEFIIVGFFAAGLLFAWFVLLTVSFFL